MTTIPGQSCPPLAWLERAQSFGVRTAIKDASGQVSYRHLIELSQNVAANLLDGKGDLAEARIAFLIPAGFEYAAVQWGIWRAGGIAVPLCAQHPRPELQDVLEDADVSTVVVHPEFQERLEGLAGELSVRLWTTPELLQEHAAALPQVAPERRAMILYTSGTTSKPKGVVTTHENIRSQITSLIEAWQWNDRDEILHFLPLHHIHGIINVLACALWSGGVCEMHRRFDAQKVIDRILQGGITLLMAVPTIYIKLIAALEGFSVQQREEFYRACGRLRLMISGSAALPVSVLHRWEALTGHRLLERYGMTEIGMGLSNPLHGERRPGFVGTPLPGVELALFDESHQRINEEGIQGEIRVRGKNVFLEYWQKPQETKKAFRDGSFCTGDIAVTENGSYRILGRDSVDIIKSGGYKISALEVEEVLRTHPAINECAVIGLEDDLWGQRVSVAWVLKPDQHLSLEQHRLWAKERLAKYKIPTRCLTVRELPRNVMGKVSKPDVKKLFDPT